MVLRAARLRTRVQENHTGSLSGARPMGAARKRRPAQPRTPYDHRLTALRRTKGQDAAPPEVGSRGDPAFLEACRLRESDGRCGDVRIPSNAADWQATRHRFLPLIRPSSRGPFFLPCGEGRVGRRQGMKACPGRRRVSDRRERRGSRRPPCFGYLAGTFSRRTASDSVYVTWTTVPGFSVLSFAWAFGSCTVIDFVIPAAVVPHSTWVSGL